MDHQKSNLIWVDDGLDWLDPTSEPTIVRMHEDWILAMFTLMSSLLVSMRRVVLLSNDYGKDLARLGEIRTWRMAVIN